MHDIMQQAAQKAEQQLRSQMGDLKVQTIILGARLEAALAELQRRDDEAAGVEPPALSE